MWRSFVFTPRGPLGVHLIGGGVELDGGTGSRLYLRLVLSLLLYLSIRLVCIGRDGIRLNRDCR